MCSQCFHSLLKVHVSSRTNSSEISNSRMSLNASAVFVPAKFRKKEISLLVWMRNFAEVAAKFRSFNESPWAMQRNFVASFGRLFVRAKDEIRRTSRSFFYTVPLVYLSVYRHAGGDNIVGSIVW